MRFLLVCSKRSRFDHLLSANVACLFDGQRQLKLTVFLLPFNLCFAVAAKVKKAVVVRPGFDGFGATRFADVDLFTAVIA